MKLFKILIMIFIIYRYDSSKYKNSKKLKNKELLEDLDFLLIDENNIKKNCINILLNNLNIEKNKEYNKINNEIDKIIFLYNLLKLNNDLLPFFIIIILDNYYKNKNYNLIEVLHEIINIKIENKILIEIIDKLQNKIIEKDDKELNSLQIIKNFEYHENVKIFEKDNKKFVIKCNKNNNKNDEIFQEFKMLNKLKKCKNVINIINFYYFHQCIVLKKFDGDLFDFNKNKLFNKKNKNLILKELENGLKCIYDNNIVHRDIKLENIYYNNIKSEIEIKYADFGISINYRSDYKEERGTLLYFSPNFILSNFKLNFKNDNWALGILIYILENGEYPLKINKSKINLFEKIKNIPNYIKEKYKNNLKSKIYKLLILDQNNN